MRYGLVRVAVAVVVIGGLWGCKKEIGGVVEEAKGPDAIELITPDLSNFEFEGGRWEYQDGVIARVGEGELHDLWLKEQYGNFVLELEYKIAAKSNSGVLIRCTDKADWMDTALEVQILETGDGTVHGQCGGIYDCLSPNFIDVARMQVTGADGVTVDLPLVADKEFAVGGAKVKIFKIYKNMQRLERNGRVLVYEGSDTGWNPALNVSVVVDGAEEKVLLEQDKPVKTEKGGLTLNFYSEKRIAEKDVATPAEEWHSMKITVNDNVIKVVSEGKEVLDMDIDEWSEAGWNPQGTTNKYSRALKEMPRKGYLGLQDHGLPVWFRNIELTVLDE
jgi:hypothetical protein